MTSNIWSMKMMKLMIKATMIKVTMIKMTMIKMTMIKMTMIKMTVTLRAVGLFLFATILLNASVPPVIAQDAQKEWAPVHPLVLSATERRGEPVSFLVILDEQPQPHAYMAQRSWRTTDLESRRNALYQYLTEFARQSQAPLWSWLDAQDVAYRPFYIINAIEVYGDSALVTALRQRPEVARLTANPQVRMAQPETSPEAERSVFALEGENNTEVPYGIAFTNAPQVWDMGFVGLGVVVASQDTGVDWDHEALISKYRGWDPATGLVSHQYNWFDAWGSANRRGCDADPQIPCDDNGHGTHTVGTILGSDTTTMPNFIAGMAPHAQWIGCRNMKGGVGTPASYTACFEFFLAPYPQGGDPFVDGMPAKAPDLINNSWYCPPSEGCDYESLQQVVETVRAAGQMVVVSAGNNGPSCGSIRYPISAYDGVFSVGAHDSSGTIAGFSSRGPVTVDNSGRMKPEIAAPGVSVRSARVGGDYSTLSGTSMAAPHVAGAVALLWSAVPELKGQIQETEQILAKSARPVPASECMPAGIPLVPNATFGYGQLDVKRAVDMALSPALVSIALTSTASTQSISAHGTITDSLTGAVYHLTTDAEAPVRLYPGSYSLSVMWQDEQTTTTLDLVTGDDVAEKFTISPNVTISLSADWPNELDPLNNALFLPFVKAP